MSTTPNVLRTQDHANRAGELGDTATVVNDSISDIARPGLGNKSSGSTHNKAHPAVDPPLPFASTRAAVDSLVALLESDDTYRPVASDIRIMLTLAEGINAQTETAAVPLTERARALLQRAEIERSVRRSVLEEGTYSAIKIGDLLGSAGKNPRDKASRLRQRGDLLGVEIDGKVLYPAFQVDASRAELRAGVAETNRALNAREDGWAVASWWLSPHARLDDGVRPADLAIAGDTTVLAQLVASTFPD